MAIAPPDLAEVLEAYDCLVNTAIGGNQRVSCPLHDDRTPSLSVNLGKQVLRCFSCDLAGSSWELIKMKEGVDFRGARSIADKSGWGPSEASSQGVEDTGGQGGYRRPGGGGSQSFRPTWGYQRRSS